MPQTDAEFLQACDLDIFDADTQRLAIEIRRELAGLAGGREICADTRLTPGNSLDSIDFCMTFSDILGVEVRPRDYPESGIAARVLVRRLLNIRSARHD